MSKRWRDRRLSGRITRRAGGKIVMAAALGMLVPLPAALAAQTVPDWRTPLWTLSVPLGATLAVTVAAVLLMARELLRPVGLAAPAVPAEDKPERPAAAFTGLPHAAGIPADGGPRPTSEAARDLPRAPKGPAGEAEVCKPARLHRIDPAPTPDWEAELRRALDRNEFRLHYQPVIDLGFGGVAGAEALLRWRHPEHGLLAAERFMPAAEASGLIEPLGRWTLEEAARQVAAWNAAGRTDLRVSVNLSAPQLGLAGLAKQVADAIEMAGTPPGRLEVELTESAAMADRDRTREACRALREVGAAIALDDFGTGGSDDPFLRTLPLDRLKIDGKLTADPSSSREAQAACSSLVLRCRNLGLPAVAKAAETADAVRALRSSGCNLFQGFFFAGPMSPEEFDASIDAITLNAFLYRLETDGLAEKRFALAG